MPSPPDVQAVRCRLIYLQTDGFYSGNRFYLSYSGSAPSPANCLTLGADISAQWATHLGPLVHPDWVLNEVDVLDLSTTSGSSGITAASHAGTNTGSVLSANTAVNCEYDIARRYRGGKPRMYLPGPVQESLQTPSKWLDVFVGDVNTGVSAFFTALEALSIGSMGTLDHVNISFYHGVYTTTPPWRGPGFKYPPKYRDVALVDPVEGYSCKSEVSSQRRRRAATTP